MPNKEPYPKPKSGLKRKIAFGPAVPTPKRASKDAREKREMPKRIGKYNMAPREKREMPKIMGSTKAQRADYARDLMNDMRSRNILRARKKRGM